MDKYNLYVYENKGWVFFEVIKGCYGLPQSEQLANDLLYKCPNKAGVHKAATTPRLWRHKWCPIQFCLVVDDLGIEYMGKKHAQHLKSILCKHYGIMEDWESSKFVGIDLKWNYATTHKDRTCQLSIKNYICDLLLHVGHIMPPKKQLLPHKHCEINYGAKEQYTHTASPGPELDKKCVKAVNNKLLVALNMIGIQQASATEVTNKAVAMLLEYVATYPNDRILYRASDMVLAAHADAGFHNETKGCSRARAHIFLAKNDPYSHWNGAILTVAQIMKFVMASAAKAELGTLFIVAQKILPLCQTLIKMGWLQPPTLIQTENTTAVGVGPNSWGDYSTKHHPPLYHESKRLLFVGAASLLHRALLSQTL
eukprot:14979868-Ditylum_brightwellii.AAC.1